MEFFNLFLFISSILLGNCYAYNDYYDSVYLHWWFWILVFGLFLLKVSCITCYVRSRRNRATLAYVHMPMPVNPAATGSYPTVHQANGAYPHMAQASAPPAYPNGTPYTPPPPAYAGRSQPVPPPIGNDTTVEKDTRMLMG